MRRYVGALVIAASLVAIGALRAEAQGRDCPTRYSCRGRDGVTQARQAFRGELYQAAPGGQAVRVGGDVSTACHDCSWAAVWACPGNTAYLLGGGIVVVDNQCATASCNAGAGRQFMVFLHRPTWPNVRHVDTVCVSPSQPLVTGPQLQGAASAAFTEEVVPVPTFAVQPNRPQVVLRKPVIVWWLVIQPPDDRRPVVHRGVRHPDRAARLSGVPLGLRRRRRLPRRRAPADQAARRAVPVAGRLLHLRGEGRLPHLGAGGVARRVPDRRTGRLDDDRWHADPDVAAARGRRT